MLPFESFLMDLTKKWKKKKNRKQKTKTQNQPANIYVQKSRWLYVTFYLGIFYKFTTLFTRLFTNLVNWKDWFSVFIEKNSVTTIYSKEFALGNALK